MVFCQPTARPFGSLILHWGGGLNRGPGAQLPHQAPLLAHSESFTLTQVLAKLSKLDLYLETSCFNLQSSWDYRCALLYQLYLFLKTLKLVSQVNINLYFLLTVAADSV